MTHQHSLASIRSTVVNPHWTDDPLLATGFNKALQSPWLALAELAGIQQQTETTLAKKVVKILPKRCQKLWLWSHTGQPKASGAIRHLSEHFWLNHIGLSMKFSVEQSSKCSDCYRYLGCWVEHLSYSLWDLGWKACVWLFWRHIKHSACTNSYRNISTFWESSLSS